MARRADRQAARVGQQASGVGGNGDVSRWIECSVSQAMAQLRADGGTRFRREGFGTGAQALQHEVEAGVQVAASRHDVLR